MKTKAAREGFLLELVTGNGHKKRRGHGRFMEITHFVSTVQRLVLFLKRYRLRTISSLIVCQSNDSNFFVFFICSSVREIVAWK